MRRVERVESVYTTTDRPRGTFFPFPSATLFLTLSHSFLYLFLSHSRYPVGAHTRRWLVLCMSRKSVYTVVSCRVDRAAHTLKTSRRSRPNVRTNVDRQTYKRRIEIFLLFLSLFISISLSFFSFFLFFSSNMYKHERQRNDVSRDRRKKERTNERTNLRATHAPYILTTTDALRLLLAH